jgi:hypothetical protein
MSSHSPEKLLSLWATKQIDLGMAMGYELQNAAKLHQAQAEAKVELIELKNRVFNLEFETKALRGEVERLTNLVEKPLPSKKRKRGARGQPKQDEP